MILPIRRPVTPMLARPASSIPEGPGWLYEPKLDGFRAIVHYDSTQLHIDSRNGKPLNRYFPERVAAFPKALAGPCVLDGEIVVCGTQGLDFEALQGKLVMHRGETPAYPASFVAFDLLAWRDRDLTALRFDKRRVRLEEALNSHPSVTIMPQTDESRAATTWRTFRASGIEGVVAKRSELPYRPGQRLMVKVRNHRFVDCVVGGYVPLTSGTPGALLLGLYDRCGTLHHVGQTSLLSAVEREEAGRLLRRLRGGKSFGEGRMPGYSRWTEQRDFDWVSVSPGLICEVAVGNIDNGRFRHVAKLARWRTDKDAAGCTYSQLVESVSVYAVKGHAPI